MVLFNIKLEWDKFVILKNSYVIDPFYKGGSTIYVNKANLGLALRTEGTRFNILKRYYSYSGTESKLTPVPVLTLSGLNNKNTLKTYRYMLKNKGGIYSWINTVNGKQYIDSAKDFYIRCTEHINNHKSNSALQSAFIKYGLENFYFVIYEYFSFKNKNLSSKALTDLETMYIKKFDF